MPTTIITFDLESVAIREFLKEIVRENGWKGTAKIQDQKLVFEVTVSYDLNGNNK